MPVNPAIDVLVSNVAAEHTVIDSAIVLLNGIAQRIADGVAAAQAGDMAPLQQLSTDVQAKTVQLADAVLTNTPQANLVGTGKAKTKNP